LPRLCIQYNIVATPFSITESPQRTILPFALQQYFNIGESSLKAANVLLEFPFEVNRFVEIPFSINLLAMMNIFWIVSVTFIRERIYRANSIKERLTPLCP